MKNENILLGSGFMVLLILVVILYLRKRNTSAGTPAANPGVTEVGTVTTVSSNGTATTGTVDANVKVIPNSILMNATAQRTTPVADNIQNAIFMPPNPAPITLNLNGGLSCQPSNYVSILIAPMSLEEFNNLPAAGQQHIFNTLNNALAATQAYINLALDGYANGLPDNQYTDSINTLFFGPASGRDIAIADFNNTNDYSNGSTINGYQYDGWHWIANQGGYNRANLVRDILAQMNRGGYFSTLNTTVPGDNFARYLRTFRTLLTQQQQGFQSINFYNIANLNDALEQNNAFLTYLISLVQKGALCINNAENAYNEAKNDHNIHDIILGISTLVGTVVSKIGIIFSLGTLAPLIAPAYAALMLAEKSALPQSNKDY